MIEVRGRASSFTTAMYCRLANTGAESSASATVRTKLAVAERRGEPVVKSAELAAEDRNGDVSLPSGWGGVGWSPGHGGARELLVRVRGGVVRHSYWKNGYEQYRLMCWDVIIAFTDKS